FQTEGTPALFAATSGPGVLGCDLTVLPPMRERWLAASYEPVVAPLDRPRAGPAPAIPTIADGRYHGESIDLARIAGLGAYLEDIQQRRGLGPQVVLWLTGTGEHHTSPIRLQGTNLFLYVDIPAEGCPSLTLVPHGNSAAERDAFIEVQDGNLDLVGVA